MGTAEHRVLTRAVRAWAGKRPHEAWEIIDRAGMSDYWPDFLAGMMDHARDRYRRRMGLRV